MTASGALAFRFAPSPNGRLHLGHAYSALLNAELSEKYGARLLVRLEDIDPTRCTRAYAEACLEDLRWLGLEWEEPVRVQSQHFVDYAGALGTLREEGLLYPCFCTRADISRESSMTDPDGAPLYSRRCAKLSTTEAGARIANGEAHAWRIDMAKALASIPATLFYPRFSLEGHSDHIEAQPVLWGDAVLSRKETPTSYHLSVVVDDALQKVTHVVRGKDLEASTDLHILLQALLRLPTPSYHHHSLLIAPEGDKLSKSRGSEAIADLRARGVTPQQIRRQLGFA